MCKLNAYWEIEIRHTIGQPLEIVHELIEEVGKVVRPHDNLRYETIIIGSANFETLEDALKWKQNSQDRLDPVKSYVLCGVWVVESEYKEDYYLEVEKHQDQCVLKGKYRHFTLEELNIIDHYPDY